MNKTWKIVFIVIGTIAIVAAIGVGTYFIVKAVQKNNEIKQLPVVNLPTQEITSNNNGTIQITATINNIDSTNLKWYFVDKNNVSVELINGQNNVTITSSNNQVTITITNATEVYNGGRIEIRNVDNTVLATSGMIVIKNDSSINNPSQNQINFSTNETSVARAIQFNVGQADCGLVQVSADNKFETREDNFNILIDVGVENASSNQVKKALVDKIYNEFVTNIDLIVISHLHFDHIGAVQTLLEDSRFNFSKTVVLNNWAEAKYISSKNKLTKTALNMFNKMNEMNLTFSDSGFWSSQPFPQNQIVKFSETNYFSVLGGKQPLKSDLDNPNAWSMTNKFVWNDQSILYTGDLAGKDADNVNKINASIEPIHYDELDSDILKAPHHGSTTENSNSTTFIQKVSPLEVWISVGNSDKYSLPDTLALERYKQFLPNNDVALIKGTNYFGNKNAKDPSVWESLNKFIAENPTINNNNKAYGDIKKQF